MPYFAFATFLELLAMPVAQQITDRGALDRYEGPDRWRVMREALRDQARREARYGCSDPTLAQIGSNCDRARAVEVLHKLRERARNRPPLPPVQRVWRSPRGVFDVMVEPELSLRESGKHLHIHVYYHPFVRINKVAAGAGVLLMQRAFARGDDAEVSCAVFDMRAGKLWRRPAEGSHEALDFQCLIAEGAVRRERAVEVAAA
ncbi:MAG: hypothetical protein MI723_03180 [Caulobacterales bacterium]|nr:hypothetical protein [Caulobacterales bacterium]